MLKRIFDIIVSTVAIVLLSPLFLVIALLLKLETPGPVFFLQTRVGLNGHRFKMFKFRKFAHGATGGPGVTMVKDPRMTKMGKILERFKLDEIPQFINVLFGQMSIVGPRPETPNFVNYFKSSDYEVLKVKPGIFGINQLIYRREADHFPKDGDPELFYIEKLMPEKLKNDIHYIKNATVFSDMSIAIRCTFAVVVEPFISRLKRMIREHQEQKTAMNATEKDFSPNIKL